MSQTRDAAERDSGVMQPNRIGIPGDRITARQFRVLILPCRVAIPPDSDVIRPYSNAIGSCSNVI